MEDETTQTVTTGRVVLFNGPPSSGKTSLVTSLQRLSAEPWFHLSLDDFHTGYVEQWWVKDEGVMFDRLVAGYLASLRELALAGNDVLAEAVITPGRRGLYETTFGATPVVLVAVRCPFELAVERELRRGDRRGGPIDLPDDYFAAVYGALTYDFEIDTSRGEPDELAAGMMATLSSLPSSPFASHVIRPTGLP
jgi:chloramphenicol 3-O phosphotransferase